MRPTGIRVLHGACPALLAALVAFLLLSAAPASAQEGTPSPPPADEETEEPRSLEPGEPAPPAPSTPGVVPGLRGAPAYTWGDSTGMVLPPLADVRGRAEIEADQEGARALRAEAERRMLKARERSVRWKAQVEIQKTRITALNRQIDAARKEKREADRRDHENQKKREERVRDYYDAMRQAYEAEAEFQKAAFDYTQARLAVAEQELRLGERWGTGGYDSRLSSDARDLERRVLLAAKDRADRMSTFASREKTWTDRRIAVLKLWGDLQK
jgi:hypothetical protein